jgi:hypothetical protein
LSPPSTLNVKIISPLNFFKRYNEAPGPFQTMSGWCVPKSTLRKVSREPFSTSVMRAIDCYFFNTIALIGPVIYTSVPLVAYRIIKESLSSDLLKIYESVVSVFELLEDRYEKSADIRFRRVFRLAFASNRRSYAKRLLGAGKTQEARKQLWISVRNSKNPKSIAKSIALLLLTYMPSKIQPKWPPSHRE